MSIKRVDMSVFKDLNSIALALLKTVDFIVSYPKTQNAYQISQNFRTNIEEIVISVSSFEKVLNSFVGRPNPENDKDIKAENNKIVKTYIKMFRELGWMVTDKNSIKVKRKIKDKKVSVYVIKSEEYDQLDELFKYSDRSSDYRKRINVKLGYNKVLVMPN